jgi:hypothetical protein
MTMAGTAGENAAIQRFARCRIDEAVAHARAFLPLTDSEAGSMILN